MPGHSASLYQTYSRSGRANLGLPGTTRIVNHTAHTILGSQTELNHTLCLLPRYLSTEWLLKCLPGQHSGPAPWLYRSLLLRARMPAFICIFPPFTCGSHQSKPEDIVVNTYQLHPCHGSLLLHPTAHLEHACFDTGQLIGAAPPFCASRLT